MVSIENNKSRRNIVTVDIRKDIYRRLKVEAGNKHYNTKEYINEVLSNVLSKREFLDTIAPNLTVVTSQENSITLLDSNKKELFDVFMKEFRLWCEKDNTSDCMHTFYVWAIPELGKLFAQKKARTAAGKKERLKPAPPPPQHQHERRGAGVIELTTLLDKSLSC